MHQHTSTSAVQHRWEQILACCKDIEATVTGSVPWAGVRGAGPCGGLCLRRGVRPGHVPGAAGAGAGVLVPPPARHSIAGAMTDQHSTTEVTRARGDVSMIVFVANAWPLD